MPHKPTESPYLRPNLCPFPRIAADRAPHGTECRTSAAAAKERPAHATLGLLKSRETRGLLSRLLRIDAALLLRPLVTVLLVFLLLLLALSLTRGAL